MGVNQRIEKSVYTPDRGHRAQMYGPLLAGNAATQTPQFTGTVIGQNISEMLNSVSRTTSQVAEHYMKIEIETQRRADDNGVMMANTYYQNQQSAFIPQLDKDKGKLAVDTVVHNLKVYGKGLEGLSQEGHTRIEELNKVAAEFYKSRQHFGRAKLIEQNSETIHRTNVEQAIKSGNVDSLMSWHKASSDKNYRFKTDLKTMVSRTMFYKQKNKVQNYSVTELKIENELLQEVDDKGSSQVFQGMNVDDVRRARREVSGLMAQRQNDNYNSLVTDIESGKTYAIEDIQELYKQDKVSLKVLQGFKKNYTSGKKSGQDAMKNKLDFDIYKASQFSDPIRKKEYFNSLKENVLASSLDIPGKISLCKEVDRLQKASNSPGGDQVADSLLYGVQQLKEKVYDKLKVYESRWYWFDKEHEKKGVAMKASELGAMKRWLKTEVRTVPEIDNYITDINKKYAEKIMLEGFRTHFGNARPQQISKIMEGK